MPEIVIFSTYILSFQGILMSLILLLKRSVRSSNNLYLVLFLLFFSLFLLGKNLYWGTFYIQNPHFIFSVASFPLLLGPFLYFYMAPKQRTIIIFLHLLPFLIVLGDHIPFYLLHAETKLEFLKSMVHTGRINFRFFAYRITIILQIAAYLVFIRKLLYNNELSVTKINWFKSISFLFGGFGIIYMLQIVVYGFFNQIENIALYFAIMMIAMACMILFLIIKIVLIPELLKWKPKHARSKFSKEKKQGIKQVLSSLMSEEKVYLNPKLRLIDIAHRINLTEHQLSQVLHESFNMNFYEFINSHRIAMAKEYLIKPEFKHFTIDAIAQESGFQSKSTFYDAFKKFVGTTPSNYKKANLS